MTITIEQTQVPLRVDETGTVRVGGTRVILDLVIRAYKRGQRPEAIVRAYDTLKLADVYAVIAYYLDHQDEIDAYLAVREKEARQLRKKIETELTPPEIRERILAARARRKC